jgi:phosphoglycerol transferase MdoB-like AlkP superfamily enzyme
MFATSPFLPALRTNLTVFAVFVVRFIVVLTAARVLLVVWQWQRVSDADMVASVFLQGLRFDLVLLGIVLLIPVLLFPLLASHRRLVPLWRGFLVIYFSAALLVITFMEFSTPSFVDQFDSRPNILFVEYLEYPREVAATLWAAYKLPLLFAMAFVTAFTVINVRQFRKIVRPVMPTGFLPALALTPLLLIVCVAMVRSTTDHRPVNPSTVALSTDPLANDLALNSTYTVLYAVYETRNESRGGFRYANIPDEEVVTEVRNSMRIPREDFTSDELPTLHQQRLSTPVARRKNLVIVVEESLGAEFVGSLGGLDLTQNIDRLASEGIWFSNLYATGTRSVRGLEALVSGFTPTPARSVVKLGKSQRNFFTIAELLRNEGYDTSFIYGGEAQFDNMRRFFMNNGFESVIDEKDYEDPVFVGSWGVSDEDLFNRAHQEFSAKGEQPFFSLVFTSSNHSPFEFPDGRIELYDEEKATVNNAVKYADYALGEFIDNAKASNYWDNTVFLIVADHNSRVYGSEIIPVERFHIPGVIVGGSIAASEFAPVSSQIDLAPTLLSLMGVAEQHPMIGHDLTKHDEEVHVGRAIMQFNTTQAYMEGDQVVIMQKDLPTKQFTYRSGQLVAENRNDPPLIKKALATSAWTSMAYEKSLYRLPKPAMALATK